MPPATTVLVADAPDSVAAFRRALTAPLDVLSASTLDEAKAALAEHPDVVICGCHFDEGRMYDLLRHIKAQPALARVPFVAVRCLEGELDDALYESVKIAVRALGGNAFVDLPRWQRKYGESDAGHRLTALIESLGRSPSADSR